MSVPGSVVRCCSTHERKRGLSGVYGGERASVPHRSVSSQALRFAGVGALRHEHGRYWAQAMPSRDSKRCCQVLLAPKTEASSLRTQAYALALTSSCTQNLVGTSSAYVKRKHERTSALVPGGPTTITNLAFIARHSGQP